VTPRMTPSTRPEIVRGAALELVHGLGVDVTKPFVLGRRGYYRDTMGVVGTNDRGIYDDAMLVVSPTAYATFNANCDPSSSGGHLASLVAGVYRYKIGIHHPGTPGAYRCLVQAGPVTVHRDNGVTESGEFYIHVHRGGYSTTSSAGCQTVHPDQYDAFLALVEEEMLRHGGGLPIEKLTIPYVLTERSAASP
jgi:hypothetical protein